ncbi:MAG: hypothetical protein DDT19_02418 [Syntrophomonadaceae bacterium]|nr:hypothetical protein [Bacillota bacterium]
MQIPMIYGRTDGVLIQLSIGDTAVMENTQQMMPVLQVALSRSMTTPCSPRHQGGRW